MNQYDLVMTKTEVKPITLEVLDLREGETVESAIVTHFPPTGSSSSVSVDVASPYLNFFMGPFETKGIHQVKVQAVGDAGSKPETLYYIDVKDI